MNKQILTWLVNDRSLKDSIMDKVYQVFVSSTYADLREERQRVSETLAKAGFIPAGMELFPAADQQQLEYIKRVIDRCDYYVVIVGGRYGSLADDNISFTEKEYEYAVSKETPVLAFLHGHPQTIPVGKTDEDMAKAAKLKAFRDRLAKGRLVNYWTEAQKLCTDVVIAVSNATNLMPGIGWVRGDQAIDPKVLQETERLRLENAELKKRLTDQSEDITFPEHLAGPTEEIELAVHGSVTRLTTKGAVTDTIVDKAVAIQFGALFMEIYDSVLTEPSEYQLCSIIGVIVAKLCLKNSFQPNGQYQVENGDVHRLQFHYEALGLIQAVGSTSVGELGGRPFHRDYIAWRITDKGRRYVTRARAIPRSENKAA